MKHERLWHTRMVYRSHFHISPINKDISAARQKPELDVPLTWVQKLDNVQSEAIITMSPIPMA